MDGQFCKNPTFVWTKEVQQRSAFGGTLIEQPLADYSLRIVLAEFNPQRLGEAVPNLSNLVALSSVIVHNIIKPLLRRCRDPKLSLAVHAELLDDRLQLQKQLRTVGCILPHLIEAPEQPAVLFALIQENEATPREAGRGLLLLYGLLRLLDGAFGAGRILIGMRIDGDERLRK